jgi:hypothetical protein
MHMTDRDFGWTVEMQIKAINNKLRVVECPLPYHARIAGQSKISRTLAGVIRAGSKILWVIGRELWRRKMNVNTAYVNSRGLISCATPPGSYCHGNLKASFEDKTPRASLVEGVTREPLLEGTSICEDPIAPIHPFFAKERGDNERSKHAEKTTH